MLSESMYCMYGAPIVPQYPKYDTCQKQPHTQQTEIQAKKYTLKFMVRVDNCGIYSAVQCIASRTDILTTGRHHGQSRRTCNQAARLSSFRPSIRHISHSVLLSSLRPLIPRPYLFSTESGSLSLWLCL